MFFIGIVSETKDSEIIKKNLKNSINAETLNIINLNKKNVENFQNITFDTVVIMQNLEKWDINIKYLDEIIRKSKILLINADIQIRKDFTNRTDTKVITFGFNPKATITISSVKEDKIILGIQRNIEKNNKEIIETQERVLEIDNQKNKKIYNKLVVFIIEELHNLN